MIIDLTNLKVFGRQVIPFNAQQLQQRGWICEYRAKTATLGEPSACVVLERDNKSIRVTVKGDYVDSVQFNPARLLHGDHATLIRNQEELTKALNLLSEALNEFSVVVAPREQWRVTSIEMGWNFPVDYLAIEPLLISCRHPWVRKKPILQAGMEWAVRGVMFLLKVYNKSKLLIRAGQIQTTVSGRPQHATRVEMKLSGRKLSEQFASCGIEGFPTFAQIQHLIRAALEVMETTPVAVAKSEASELASLVAQLALEGVKVGGRDPLDFVCHGMTAPRARRLRRRVDAAVVQRSQFSVALLFGPAGTWPPPLELY
jgi:hypothetical protein